MRYFARFKGDFGYLRAVIRYGSTRKTITTPLVITAEQLTQLDSAGHISQPLTDADHRLDGKLRQYSNYIWQTVNPLLESGEFDAIPSEQLTTAISDTKKAEEARREKELKEFAEAEFRKQQEFAKRYGVTLTRTTPEEVKRLQRELTPEEFSSLWETPQWVKDYAAENYREFMANRNKRAEEGETDGER